MVVSMIMIVVVTVIMSMIVSMLLSSLYILEKNWLLTWSKCTVYRITELLDRCLKLVL